MHVRLLCEKGASELAAALLSVVNDLPKTRFGGSFTNGFVDAIHRTALVAQAEAARARSRGEDARAAEYIRIGLVLRQCRFIPWWARWMREAVRARLRAYCADLVRGDVNADTGSEAPIAERFRGNVAEARAGPPSAPSTTGYSRTVRASASEHS
ncbi:hypothetical protein LZC95_20245 [Pendulispora brunnea]|uniref:Uncharacterized protein n=1 Tax=Pendulispora brunnea TaxID=2905690 RepID=A0ABZ2KPZ5_9BACT